MAHRPHPPHIQAPQSPPYTRQVIVGPALSLIADMVNHDPAPPGLLLHTIGSGVAEMALHACQAPGLHFTADLLHSVSSLVSALCLTSDGVDLLKRVNPFPHLFSLMLDGRYYHPYSKVFTPDTETPHMMYP